MMPSVSKKQHNFMEAIAHSPSFAKKVGVPQKVGQDFSKADKGRKFSQGGDMKKGYADGGMTMVNKGGKMVPDFAADGVGKMAKGGMSKMAKGGMAKSDMKEDMKADLKQDKAMMQKAVNKHEGRLHKGASMTKLAGGGTFRAAANGIAQRGKTKGTQIKMNKGGMAC
jgi:hypothetical protein